MRCQVSYRDPTGSVQVRGVDTSVSIGRDPARSDLLLTPPDPSISGVAVVIAIRDEHVVVRNTSTYAQVDVMHEFGTRFLFPGEELATSESLSVAVPSSTFRHVIQVEVEDAKSDVTGPTGTSPLMGSAFVVPPERHLSLVGLCAARFRPDRFGSALLSASEIAMLISKGGDTLTAKAVNNKLQRLRDDVAERLGLYLETREDLADWAIRNGYVTRSDVERLLT